MLPMECRLLTATIKNATEVASRTKTSTTIPPSNPTLKRTEKPIFQKDTCTPTSTVILFTTAKACKHPKCPSIHQWIKKVDCIHTDGRLLSDEEKWYYATCGNLDGSGDDHSKSDWKRQISHDIMSKWNGIKDTNVLVYQIETDTLLRDLRLPKGKAWVEG